MPTHAGNGVGAAARSVAEHASALARLELQLAALEVKRKIGSLALGIIMLPLISRSTQEVLALVPNHLREGSLALGVSKWRTIVGVILPTTFSGILTGTTLAVARAAGETAPLLFTSSLFGDWVSGNVGQPIASIPVIIFEYSEAPDPHLNDQAWAAAFVLITFVLVVSLLSRAALARSRSKLERG